VKAGNILGKLVLGSVVPELALLFKGIQNG
jgi:hypothetical protein